MSLYGIPGRRIPTGLGLDVHRQFPIWSLALVNVGYDGYEAEAVARFCCIPTSYDLREILTQRTCRSQPPKGLA